MTRFRKRSINRTLGLLRKSMLNEDLLKHVNKRTILTAKNTSIARYKRRFLNIQCSQSMNYLELFYLKRA